MKDIADCVSGETEGISRVLKIYENTAPDNLMIDVIVAASAQGMIWESAMEFQKKLAETIESMTAFNVVKVNVEVRWIE